jgi:hypothetical protein
MSEQQLDVVVLYVYPVFGGDHDTYARRFVESYRKHFPTTQHRLVVVSNGGEPTPEMKKVFAGVELSWLEHDDSGWDIGAYRKAAHEMPDADLMVFFGGSSHVRGPRWLERAVEAFQEHGPNAVYGAMGSLGNNVHIRTTAFWLAPALLNRYPYETTDDRASRYEFEHGKHGLSMWALAQGYKVWMVTWGGCFQHWEWDYIPNGFHQGDQSALLAWDRLADPPYHVPVVKQTHAPPGTEVIPVFSELEKLRATQSTSLALVYVVRASSNMELPHRFFTAYRKFHAGVAHDLVIGAVGFESEAATLLVKQTVWSDVTPQPAILVLPDPGFMLGLFREACLRLSTKYVCLLSELSRPLTNDWLKKLHGAASRAGVGIAGATGAHQIAPHVRDNGFCVDRELFLELTAGVRAADAHALQVGPTSITTQVRARGLQARIVSRSGDFDVAHDTLRESRTFWWGAQEELLISDDQTDDYANGSEAHKAFLRSAGWPSPIRASASQGSVSGSSTHASASQGSAAASSTHASASQGSAAAHRTPERRVLSQTRAQRVRGR